MAENKKTFIWYLEWNEQIRILNKDEQLSVLNWIMDYVEDKNPEIPNNKILQLVINPIKRTLKEDLVKWKDTQGKRIEAGKMGGLAKASKCKQMLANDSNDKQNLANLPVYVNDNVNVNVNENVSVINNKTLKEHKAPKSGVDLALDEFASMRNKMKKPLTGNAIKRLKTRLEVLCGEDDDLKIKVLFQSIDKGWLDIYPLKENSTIGQEQHASTYNTELAKECGLLD